MPCEHRAEVHRSYICLFENCVLPLIVLFRIFVIEARDVLIGGISGDQRHAPLRGSGAAAKAHGNGARAMRQSVRIENPENKHSPISHFDNLARKTLPLG